MGIIKTYELLIYQVSHNFWNVLCNLVR